MQEVDFNEIEKDKTDLVSNRCVDTFFKMLDLIREEGREGAKPKFEVALKALVILILQGASETEKCAFFEVLLQAISPNQWSRYFLGYLEGVKSMDDANFLAKSTYRLRAEMLAAKWNKSISAGSFGYQTLNDHSELVNLLVALQNALEPVIFKAMEEPITVYADDVIQIVVQKIIRVSSNNDDSFSRELNDDMRKLERDLAHKELIANPNPLFGQSEEHANVIKALVKRINQLEQSRNEANEILANKGAEISRCYAKLEYENSKLKEFRYPKRTNQSHPDSIQGRLTLLQSEVVPALLNTKNQLTKDCDELAAELAKLEADITVHKGETRSKEAQKADIIKNCLNKQYETKTASDDQFSSRPRFF